MLTVFIRLVYSIPSIVLYCLVVMAIFKERQRFHKSFYSLLIVQAVTNVFVFINGFYVVHLANETDQDSWWKFIYTDAPQYLIRICTCLGTHFSFVQTYTTFFISLNRMTAILWPLKHEMLWTYGLPTSVFIIYLTPFFATFPYLTHSIAFVYSTKTNCYISTSEIDRNYIWLQIFVFCSIFVVASFLVHSISVVSLCKYVKRTNYGNADRRMLALALLNFLIEISFFILLTLIFISRYGMESFNSHVVLMLIPYASDVFTLSIPYLIMILNTGVRSRVMSYMGCGCPRTCGKTTVQDLRPSETSENGPYTVRCNIATGRSVVKF